jgi:hypothetical protein
MTRLHDIAVLPSSHVEEIKTLGHQQDRKSILHYAPVDGRDQLEIAQFLISNNFSTVFDSAEDLDTDALKPLSETAFIGNDVIELFKEYEENPERVIASLSHLTLSVDDLKRIREGIYKHSRHFYLSQNPLLGNPAFCFDVRANRVAFDNDYGYDNTDDEDDDDEDEDDDDDNDDDNDDKDEEKKAVDTDKKGDEVEKKVEAMV